MMMALATKGTILTLKLCLIMTSTVVRLKKFILKKAYVNDE
jgi:hypothetical protein